MAEDSEHLFILCRRVLHFRQHFEDFLYKRFHQHTRFSWKHIVTGVDLGVDSEYANLVLTLAAFTIFKTWVMADKDLVYLNNINVWTTFLCEIVNRVYSQPDINTWSWKF